MLVAVLLYPGASALDFVGPYEVLRWLPEAEVRFVWHETGPVTADSGVFVVAATHTFDETPAPDVVVVPGGFTTMEHAGDPRVLDWVRSAHTSAAWTTSVCSGSLILAAAGLLDGRRATSHWAALGPLRALGAVAVSDERIVSESLPDGRHIVTCAGVSAGLDLSLWLAGEIAGEERAKAIQLSMEYDPQPPFDSGHTSKASARTRAAATALMAEDMARPGQARTTARTLWDGAVRRARDVRGRRTTRKRILDRALR